MEISQWREEKFGAIMTKGIGKWAHSQLLNTKETWTPWWEMFCPCWKHSSVVWKGKQPLLSATAQRSLRRLHTSLLPFSILSDMEKIYKWNSLPMISASRTLRSWQHRLRLYQRTFLRVVRFHGKERMQMRATDKTYPGDIMILLETFRHLRQCFPTSSPPPRVQQPPPAVVCAVRWSPAPSLLVLSLSIFSHGAKNQFLMLQPGLVSFILWLPSDYDFQEVIKNNKRRIQSKWPSGENGKQVQAIREKDEGIIKLMRRIN